MQSQDIEAELSYAYLHAVAAHASIACDATLSMKKDFGPDAALTEISLHVQLKATVKPSRPRKGRLSYFFEDLGQYERLRQDTALPPRILGVLFLPNEPSKWLTHSPEQLVLCHCAYWVCLIGAPQSENRSGQTIYFPETQTLSPSGLLHLFGRLARRERLCYAP